MTTCGKKRCALIVITVPDVERRVLINVPGNVFHVLHKLGFYTLGLYNTGWYCLERL